MKTLVLVLTCLLTVFSPAVLVAQTVMQTAHEGGSSYPTSAHDILWKQEEEINRYVLSHPEVMAQARLQKTAAWGFTVGSTYSWYADDLTTTNTRYAVPATCRAVGQHCYVFVEDASWGSRVTQAAVDSVVNAFDNATPANAAKGVFQTDVESFGNPPDVDSDPRIIILILDIKDGYTGSGGYVAGYFYSYNEIPKTTYPTSNEAEIYFLDCNPLNLATSAGIQTGMSTTAHEFQHMIHWNYNKLNDTFTNEGCSLMAEVICGYPFRSQAEFADEPNHYLFDWRRTDLTLVLNDYSRAARFFLYMQEQFGTPIFKAIVGTNLTGSARLDAALAAFTPTTSRRFADIFQDWLVANYLNDKSVDSKWGYSYPSVTRVSPTLFMDPHVSSTMVTVANLGGLYLSFRSGTSLSTTISSVAAPSNFWIRAIETGPGGKRVLPVSLGVQFDEPAFGTSYTDITYLIGCIDPATPHDVTYASTGTSVAFTELKWDLSEPSGYLPNAAGDTVCVQFDGYPGARLDSVRVALRRTGSMTGGIWRSTGVVQPTPLGTPLAGPITVTGLTNPPSPYPVPWPNWGSADLHALNIDASQPFAAAFACTGSASVDNRVMVTRYPSTISFHSFTYISSSSGWYYYTANQAGDTVYIYLIRAYVSVPTTVGRETVELLPSSTQLLQNFPNPFNPTTVIRYQLAAASDVRITVFDLMGREVAMLVHDTQQPGRYETRWQGMTDAGIPASSGVYFCRLEAGSFVRTLRMMLLR
jgi:hypothetical protein